MIKLLQGDCLVESKKIKSGSVDLILTDLPYGNMNTDGGRRLGINGWDKAIPPNKVYEIANRILRKNGKMILFSQEPYTTELINEANPNVPFSYRAVWEKDTFANALGVNRNMVSFYEDILVFSKTHDHEALHPLREYFDKVRQFIKEPAKVINEKLGNQMSGHYFTKGAQFAVPTKENYYKLIKHFNIDRMGDFKTFEELHEIDQQAKDEFFPNVFNLWEGNKYKSNILKYKKDYDGYHPTQKPVALLEDLIKTFSNEGDTVVDLTMGSGSTGVACVNTNRNFIGFELDKEYFDVANERINNHKRELK